MLNFQCFRFISSMSLPNKTLKWCFSLILLGEPIYRFTHLSVKSTKSYVNYFFTGGHLRFKTSWSKNKNKIRNMILAFGTKSPASFEFESLLGCTGARCFFSVYLHVLFHKILEANTNRVAVKCDQQCWRFHTQTQLYRRDFSINICTYVRPVCSWSAEFLNHLYFSRFVHVWLRFSINILYKKPKLRWLLTDLKYPSHPPH